MCIRDSAGAPGDAPLPNESAPANPADVLVEPRVIKRVASGSALADLAPRMVEVGTLQPRAETRALFKVGGVRLMVDEVALVKRLLREEDPGYLACDVVGPGGTAAASVVRVRGGAVEIRDVSAPLVSEEEVRAATRVLDLGGGASVDAAPGNPSVVEVSTAQMRRQGMAPVQLSTRRPHVLRAWIGAAAEAR